MIAQNILRNLPGSRWGGIRRLSGVASAAPSVGQSPILVSLKKTSSDRDATHKRVRPVGRCASTSPTEASPCIRVISPGTPGQDAPRNAGQDAPRDAGAAETGMGRRVVAQMEGKPEETHLGDGQNGGRTTYRANGGIVGQDRKLGLREGGNERQLKQEGQRDTLKRDERGNVEASLGAVESRASRARKIRASHESSSLESAFAHALENLEHADGSAESDTEPIDSNEESTTHAHDGTLQRRRPAPVEGMAEYSGQISGLGYNSGRTPGAMHATACDVDSFI